MATIYRTALALAVCCTAAAATPALAQVTFYEHDQFGGRSFSTPRGVGDFTGTGFNDRASSVVVARDRWEVCDDAQFAGRCVVLRAGSYPSLSAMGMNDRVSSARKISLNARVDDNRYAPMPPPPSRWQRQGNERLYEANVTSVRAVMGPAPERSQRCWVEREPVAVQRNSNQVGGAIVGALLGGILGHQIGGGTGRDIATVGGVVAGAAVGSHVAGRGDRDGGTQDVQRCAPTLRDMGADRRPEYWDVSYNFRGQDHRVQMTHAPGNTVTVNRQGEPRG